MTLDEAVNKWGVSKSAVLRRLKRGEIPGAKMMRYAPKERRKWYIPDDAPAPKLIKKPNRMPPLPKAPQGSTAPVDYVWANQNSTIGSVARALGVSRGEVTNLYDKACRKYLYGEEGCHVPQEP